MHQTLGKTAPNPILNKMLTQSSCRRSVRSLLGSACNLCPWRSPCERRGLKISQTIGCAKQKKKRDTTQLECYRCYVASPRTPTMAKSWRRLLPWSREPFASGVFRHTKHFPKLFCSTPTYREGELPLSLTCRGAKAKRSSLSDM